MTVSPNFRVHSCWSKAGFGTSIVLEFSPRDEASHDNHQPPMGDDKKPGTRIAMDLGATGNYEDSIHAGTVLLTHSHIDHLGAIFSHARAYSMSHGGAVPTYYAPAEVVPLLEQARQTMAALDSAVLSDERCDGMPIRKSKQLKMNFCGVRPGDEVVLSHLKHTQGMRVFVRVVRMFHAGCPAVGYVLGTRHTPQLKPEFRGKPKEEIRAALDEGIAIKTEPIDVLEVAYTGDTSVDTFTRSEMDVRNPVGNKNSLYLEQLLGCPVIICESTFLMKDEEELARARGHMHLKDVVSEVISRGTTDLVSEGRLLQQQFLLVHVSARYDARRILDQMAAAIPRHMWGQCHAAISSHVQYKDEWRHSVQCNGCISLLQYMEEVSDLFPHHLRSN